MRRSLLTLSAIAFALAGTSARADVVAKTEIGFVSRNTVEVAAKPEVVWAALITPSGWWNPQHTYSADAANLSLVPVAGGCFCEKLPLAKDAAKGAPAGSVEHMRVIYVVPGTAVRLTGGLGPLQSEAVSAVLTITLKPTEKGTRILFEYVVGGYMRYSTDQIGPAVDKVMLEQLGRLALKIDPTATGRGTLVPAGPPAPPPAGGADKAPKAPLVGPPAPKPAPKADTVSPPATEDPADKARGAEAAAALESIVAPKKPAVAAPATKPAAAAPAPAPAPAAKAAPAAVAAAAPAPPPGNYVERTLGLRASGKALEYFDPAAPEVPVAVAFASPRLAADFAAKVAAFQADPANKGKAAVCSCTGRVETVAGMPVFAIIDAAVTSR